MNINELNNIKLEIYAHIIVLFMIVLFTNGKKMLFVCFLCAALAVQYGNARKSGRNISPTLLSDDPTGNSKIEFKTETTETFVVKYVEREGTVYLPTETMVSTDVTDAQGKLLEQKQVPSLTYTETVTQTLMWWVLKEQVEVMVPSTYKSKLYVGIVAACCGAAVAFFLGIRWVRNTSCTCSCSCDYEETAQQEHPTGTDAVEVNYGEEMQNLDQDEQGDAPEMPVPQEETPAVEQIPEITQEAAGEQPLPENPYEDDVRNDWD